jgi:hypothetical protein
LCNTDNTYIYGIVVYSRHEYKNIQKNKRNNQDERSTGTTSDVSRNWNQLRCDSCNNSRDWNIAMSKSYGTCCNVGDISLRREGETSMFKKLTEKTIGFLATHPKTMMYGNLGVSLTIGLAVSFVMAPHVAFAGILKPVLH